MWLPPNTTAVLESSCLASLLQITRWYRPPEMLVTSAVHDLPYGAKRGAARGL
jgi:hypothetical protein